MNIFKPRPAAGWAVYDRLGQVVPGTEGQPSTDAAMKAAETVLGDDWWSLSFRYAVRRVAAS